MILYIETNFIVGGALGQESRIDELLKIPRSQLQIFLPSICIMESWSVFERMRADRNRFYNEPIDREIRELKRNRTSSSARSLQDHLEAAQVENETLLNDIGNGIFNLLSKLAGRVEGFEPVELLAVDHHALVDSLAPTCLDEPTDFLIVTAIAAHARKHPDLHKAFLSANTRDFKKESFKYLLDGANIKYFGDSTGLLNWLRPSGL